MKDIWADLAARKKPFLVLAPMDDVTDSPFRQIIAEAAPPDLFYTEFVNVDALSSPGRDRALKKLIFADKERPIIAQIWGKQVENFEPTAAELVEMGFDGVDLNFGCPDKTVVKNQCCSALAQPELWGRANDIIQSTKRGINGRIPLSIKCRTGFDKFDIGWHRLLLEHKPAALIVHGRTTKQMSKVPNNWDHIEQIRQIRDSVSTQTVFVGNGDVVSSDQAKLIAKERQIDGIMIGRGVFSNPYIFADDGDMVWAGKTTADKLRMYRQHIQMHADLYGGNRFAPLKKFAKIYINDFAGAKELRNLLMQSTDYQQMIGILDSWAK